MIELGVEADYSLVNKRNYGHSISPKNINISCIFRDPHVIIPNGSTVIKPDDKLIIISTPNEQEEIIEFIRKKK